MKKLLSAGMVLSLMASTVSAADTQNRDNPSSRSMNRPIVYGEAPAQNIATDPAFVLLDVILYRPVGLALTIAGTALYVGLSPLTAMASIPEPHDAFEKTYKVLIRMPARYTFVRPVGDRSLSGYEAFYDEPGANQPVRYDYDLLPAIGKPMHSSPPAPKTTPSQRLQPATSGAGRSGTQQR